jgi:hypothetical protein
MLQLVSFCFKSIPRFQNQAAGAVFAELLFFLFLEDAEGFAREILLFVCFANVFFIAFSGIPPNIKVETSTPVSMTTLSLSFVGFLLTDLTALLISFIVNFVPLNASQAILRAASSLSSGESTERI